MSQLYSILQRPNVVAATHSGTFHADDVLAAATLRLIKPSVTILRSRDTDQLNAADILFDVGRILNPATCRFDHHQLEYKEARPNGIPYSSFGLVWRELGDKLCGSAAAANRVDVALVQGVDAVDCGVTICKEVVPVKLMSISAVLGSFNQGWQDLTSAETINAAFEQAVSVAKLILENAIREASGFEKAKAVVEQSPIIEGGRVLALEHGVPWKETVLESSKYEQLLYVIYPDAQAKWHLSCVPDKSGSFSNRKSLPAAWAGLDGEELDKVTGIKGCVFCHRARFVGGHTTKEGVIEMARLALRE
ncbi:MAG: MYG1 family protein [Gallionellaceae bacterium]|jgi:uncharacterized UPF0160 family protein